MLLLLWKVEFAEDGRPRRDGRLDVEEISDTLGVGKPHPRAEAHRAYPVVRGGRAVAKRPFDVLYAGALVLRDDWIIIFTKLQLLTIFICDAIDCPLSKMN